MARDALRQIGYAVVSRAWKGEFVVRASVGIAVIIACTPTAHASDVDWKLYGGAKVNGVSDYCFYDASGVVTQADAHVRVWTKCLLQDEVESVDIEKQFSDKPLEDAAQKVARGYVPPIIVIGKMDFKKIADVVVAETIADISNAQPVSRILYELNCSQTMFRELNITIQGNGKFGSVDKPTDWKYIASETNGANLHKILCPR